MWEFQCATLQKAGVGIAKKKTRTPCCKIDEKCLKQLFDNNI